MKKAMTYMMSVVLSLIPVAGGILLIAFPDRAVMMAFLILSIFMIWSGVKNLWYSVAFTALPKGIRTMGIVKNAISILFGALMVWKCITSPSSLMNFVVYLLASYLLVTAVIDFIDTSWMRRLSLSNGIGADALLNLVFSLIMFFFPRLIGSTFLTFIGILLIVVGAFLLAGVVFSIRNRLNDRKHAPGKGEPIDVDFEER